MKFTSYWLDTAPPFTSAASGPPEGDADVAVVGAGFTGLSAALALARKGAKVVVLEAGPIAGAASGRNGGMCNNGFAQDFHSLATTLGLELAKTLYRAFDAGVAKVEQIVTEEQIDCQFSRVGKLKLAAKPEHYTKLARSQALMAEHVDPETRMVRQSELRAEIGSDRYFGGLLFEKSAGMHMGRFSQGLAEAAARRGARIHPHTPVVGLRRLSGQSYEVRTPQSSLRARQVLLATGTSSVGPLGWIRRRIVPVGAFLIVTEPLPVELLDRLTPRRRNTTDTRNFVNYFRVTPDNRLLFGGRARFATSRPCRVCDEPSALQVDVTCTPGRRPPFQRPSIARSICAASCSSKPSWPWRACVWMPSGRPLSCTPKGMDRPGMPHRLVSGV